MQVQLEIDHLNHKKSKIEALLTQQQRSVSSKLDIPLEKDFWKDRQDRIMKMIVRSIWPGIIFFILFELVSLPINYFTTPVEQRIHDVGLTLVSYSVGWIVLLSIYTVAKKVEWNRYYPQVMWCMIAIGLTIVQSVLLSTHTLSMTWRGTLIIAFATMFAYLCSGLKPGHVFGASSLAAVLSCAYLILTDVQLPLWVVTNTLILSNLVGLALATLSISTERIRFLQSIIIDYDKQIYSKLNQHFVQLSHQDTLTLLGNRRGFDQQLKQAIQDTQSTGQAFGLLFADVDFFKNYNDYYGHAQGDHALVRVAQTLLRHIQDQDQAIRYGGKNLCCWSRVSIE